MHVTDRIGPFDLRRGPWAGLRLIGELFRLPSGDWQIDLVGTSITGRAPGKTFSDRFFDYFIARQHLRRTQADAQELSCGPIIDNVTAY